MVTPELICDQTFTQTCFCAQTPGGQKAVHALCWMGEARGNLDVPRLVGAQGQALPTPCPVLSAGGQAARPPPPGQSAAPKVSSRARPLPACANMQGGHRGGCRLAVRSFTRNIKPRSCTASNINRPLVPMKKSYGFY